MNQCERCGEVRPAEIHTCTPQREWKGLTEAERKVLWLAANNMREFGEMVEAKLKEKNK